MLKLIILGVIFASIGQSQFTSDKKWNMENIPSFKSYSQRRVYSTFSSSSEETTPFSNWELSMLSQMLVDISLNRCDQIGSDQMADFRTYVERVVDRAPHREAVNKNFMELYDSLVECFRLSVEASNRERNAKEIQLSNLHENDIETSIKIDPTGVVSQPNNNIQAVPSVTFVDRTISSLDGTINQKLPTTVESVISSTPETEPVVIPSTHKRLKSKKKDKGVLNTVGHLFTKLYDNTISIFSSIFGRKKRDSSITDQDDDSSSEDSNGGMTQTRKQKRKFYSKSRSSYTKEVYNRNRDGPFVENEEEPSSVNRKQKLKRTSHFRNNNFIKLSRSHFRTVFKSMSQVVKESCPSQVMPHRAVLKSALREIFSHLKEDSERRAENGVGVREAFPLNFQLQRQIQQCGQDLGEAVA